MRALGLVMTLVGCVLAVASLWARWADGQPGSVPAPDRDGWAWLGLTSVLLVAACASVAAIAIALYAGGRSPRASRVAAVSSIFVLLCAFALVALVKLLTGLNLAFLDDEPQPLYDDGSGPGRAAAGLAVALVGTLVSVTAGHRRRRRERYSAPGVPGTTGESGSSTWNAAPSPGEDST